jgi:hypothetical protein
LQGSAKLSYDEWHRALLEIDENVLTCPLLQKLRQALPPAEMLKKLCDIGMDQYNEMPEGEQFAAKIATIRQLTVRLDMIIFKMQFDETVENDLKPVNICNYLYLILCVSRIFLMYSKLAKKFVNQKCLIRFLNLYCLSATIWVIRQNRTKMRMHLK